ncbi:SDR family NAD(P)-dependent oxidoreductase [Deinococcus detaillensis]|uniref:SDR family NAD(P)-dependent oxidoreductase n=1 Tax=Deinococcus detaillensis TaxID=2592048 RepID=A0A553V5Z0_9DEIO|nr:SDR family NAD(P)-dependent oxidoreductase [Deinococcus detaillensis]TSA87641.1 SDR family NAD(P)-dependent oxidoreductase [Deinococcus detaillensis]
MNNLVAVTGAEGFIGSHLVEALVKEGFKVRAMVLYNSFSSWGWLEQLSADVMEHVEVMLGDVRDPRSVRDLMQGAEVVYHLAALIAIPYSYQAPHSYVQTNVIGTLNVLEAARELGTPRLIHTSTSEVYGTALQVPIHESHPLQAQSPYAASKVGADKLVESYVLSFGLPAVTLRPFNTYGPRQSARAVIPTIISQIAAKQPVIKIGSLAPTRDFNYVADTAASFVAVGRAEASQVLGQTLNTGTGVEISVGALIQAVADIMNRRVEIQEDAQRLRPDASEVMRLVSDSSALRRLTGWEPQYPLHAGLEQTSQWFLDERNLAHYKVGQYTI